MLGLGDCIKEEKRPLYICVLVCWSKTPVTNRWEAGGLSIFIILVCVCVHVCLCLCNVCVCLSLDTCMHVYVDSCSYSSVFVHVRMHTCTYVCNIYISACMLLYPDQQHGRSIGHPTAGPGEQWSDNRTGARERPGSGHARPGISSLGAGGQWLVGRQEHHDDDRAWLGHWRHQEASH